MATNQELRHASFRAVSGTTGTYNEDLYAMCLTTVSDQGSLNGTLLAFLQDNLGSSSTNLPDLMNAFAISQGYTNWNSMGTFTLTEYYLELNDSGPQYFQTDTLSVAPTIKRMFIHFRPHSAITTSSGTLETLISSSLATNKWLASASSTTSSIANERLTFWGVNSVGGAHYAAINDRDITADWHTVDVTYNETTRKYSDILYDDIVITAATAGASDGIMTDDVTRITLNAYGNGATPYLGVDIRTFKVWDDNDNLVFNFAFNEGSGNPVNSVTGNEGSLVGGTWREV